LSALSVILFCFSIFIFPFIKIVLALDKTIVKDYIGFSFYLWCKVD